MLNVSPTNSILYIGGNKCYPFYIIYDVLGLLMEIFDYTTAGGKNLIMEYILSQPVKDKTVLLAARKLIRTRGVKAFSMLNTRQ